MYSHHQGDLTWTDSILHPQSLRTPEGDHRSQTVTDPHNLLLRHLSVSNTPNSGQWSTDKPRRKQSHNTDHHRRQTAMNSTLRRILVDLHLSSLTTQMLVTSSARCPNSVVQLQSTHVRDHISSVLSMPVNP